MLETSVTQLIDFSNVHKLILPIFQLQSVIFLIPCSKSRVQFFNSVILYYSTLNSSTATARMKFIMFPEPLHFYQDIVLINVQRSLLLYYLIKTL